MAKNKIKHYNFSSVDLADLHVGEKVDTDFRQYYCGSGVNYNVISDHTEIQIFSCDVPYHECLSFKITSYEQLWGPADGVRFRGRRSGRTTIAGIKLRAYTTADY